VEPGAQVALDVLGVRWVGGVVRRGGAETLKNGFRYEWPLVGSSPVDDLLAHARPGGDTVDRQPGIAALDQEVTRGLEDRLMAGLRNLAIGVHRQDGHTNIAAALRHTARDWRRPLTALGITG
jgi:hypothetical protein